MSDSYCGSEYSRWEEAGLADFGDFSDRVEYVNQRDDYCDSMRGDWYYAPDAKDCPAGTRVLYFGTFGNDHSPGASHYTNAEVFDMGDRDDVAAFERELKSWTDAPEYV